MSNGGVHADSHPSRRHSRPKPSGDGYDEDDSLMKLWSQGKGQDANDGLVPSHAASLSRSDRPPEARPSLASKFREEVGQGASILFSEGAPRATIHTNHNLTHPQPPNHNRAPLAGPSRTPTGSMTEKASPQTHSDERGVLTPAPSFRRILLPHELALPENAKHVALNAKGELLKGYLLSYDPELDKDKKNAKGKIPAKANLRTGEGIDPRNKTTKRKARREVRLLTWKWNTNSTRPKPPPPPRTLVVSGLSPMVTIGAIKQHFAVYGRIEEADLKLDPSSGMSTGVAYVCFAHDYDDELKLLPDVSEARAQRGDLVAQIAKEKSVGQRIAQQEYHLAFDSLDRTTWKQTYRDLLLKKQQAYLKAREEVAQQQKQRLQQQQQQQPPPHQQQQQQQQQPLVQQAPLPQASTPKTMAPPANPRGTAQIGHGAGSPSILLRPYGGGGRFSEAAQSSSPREHHPKPLGARGAENARSSSLSSNDHSRRQEDASRSSDHNHVQTGVEEESTKSILNRLAVIGHPYVYVPRSPTSPLDKASLEYHYRNFRPTEVWADMYGWYIAFAGPDDAIKAYQTLYSRTLNGVRLRSQFQPAPLIESTPIDEAAVTRTDASDSGSDKASAQQKTNWTDEELLDDSKLLVLSELGVAFIRDLKTRVLNNFVTEILRPDRPAGELIQAAKHEPVKVEEIEVTDDYEGPKSFNRAAKEEKRRRILELQEEAAHAKREAELERKQEAEAALLPKPEPEHAEEEEEEEEEETAVVKPAKKKAAAKKTSKSSKAEAAAAAATEAASVIEESMRVDERKVKAAKSATKKAAAGPAAPGPPPDPFAIGLAEEEEDLYFCRIALEMMQSGKSVDDLPDDVYPTVDEGEDEEGTALPIHTSGSARTEGFYRIPPAEKGRHLADRNLGSTADASAASANVGLASARDNRADSRRFAQGIEQHKKESATDTDILKFNQLRSRKKQLKFAKSPIHDWGLYAMELIPPGDMVIEYVGEIVRQQVADEREKMYERQGNFSTYLFRVDDDVVVDATKKGNIARLMNHCCTPNCNAKILTLNGEKRIVLFAKVAILPGQELTYDYKFQATGDEEDAIACLCGSPGCRRFL